MIRSIKLSLIIVAHVIAFTTASLVIPNALAGQHDIKNNLLFLRNGDIWAFDFESRNEIQLTHSKNITNYCVSADARLLAYVKEIKKIFVYDMASGSEEFIAETFTDASQPSFSPRGDKIALIGLTKEKIQVRLINNTTISEKVRHVWIVDIKTKSMLDITSDVAYQHSHVNWSPDGKRLLFASHRMSGGAFPYQTWKVYVMELGAPDHKTVAISDGGMSSVWLNNEQIVVSEGIATNILSIYDVKTKTKTSFSTIRAGSSSTRFSLGGPNNEVIYYEEFSPESERDALLRSHNTHTDKTEDVVKNARVPQYVK